MSLIISILLYTSIFIIGYLLMSLLSVKNMWEKLAVGWLIATNALTYVYFLLYSVFNFRFTTINLVILLIVIAMLLLLLTKFKKNEVQITFKDELDLHFKKLHGLKKEKVTLVLIFLVLIPIFIGFLLNLHWPVMDWDALALYDFRAKVISTTGGLEDGISRGYFLHYPLYTSLLHTFSYLFNLESARVWYSFFYLCSLVAFYELLQRHVSQKQALIGTFFLAISPRIYQHSQMTYTNLPHAMYLALGYIYLGEWWRKGNKTDVIIGSILIAASTWVRLTEPLWIPALGILLLGALKWRTKQQIIYSFASALLIVCLRFPWTTYVAHHDKLSITNPLQIGGGLQISSDHAVLLTRIVEVYNFFMISVIPVFKEYTPALMIAGFYILYKKRWHELTEYLFFFLLLLYIYAGIFLFSFQFKGWQEIPDSATRMAMFLIPIIIYLIMKSELWSTIQRKTNN